MQDDDDAAAAAAAVPAVAAAAAAAVAVPAVAAPEFPAHWLANPPLPFDRIQHGSPRAQLAKTLYDIDRDLFIPGDNFRMHVATGTWHHVPHDASENPPSVYHMRRWVLANGRGRGDHIIVAHCPDQSGGHIVMMVQPGPTLTVHFAGPFQQVYTSVLWAVQQRWMSHQIRAARRIGTKHPYDELLVQQSPP